MKARSLVNRRVILGPKLFADLVLWEVPTPVAGSLHEYKYRLALVADGICVLRYDNEAGKGDHIHRGGTEQTYRFAGIDRLVEDFMADVGRWRYEHPDA